MAERTTGTADAVAQLTAQSTSTKEPRYRDTLYVEELIGPDTVDTVPDHTLTAFRDHGRVRRTLDRDVDMARAMPT